MGCRGAGGPLRLSSGDAWPLVAPGPPLHWLSLEGAARWRLQGSQECGVWGVGAPGMGVGLCVGDGQGSECQAGSRGPSIRGGSNRIRTVTGFTLPRHEHATSASSVLDGSGVMQVGEPTLG